MPVSTARPSPASSSSTNDVEDDSLEWHFLDAKKRPSMKNRLNTARNTLLDSFTQFDVDLAWFLVRNHVQAQMANMMFHVNSYAFDASRDDLLFCHLLSVYTKPLVQVLQPISTDQTVSKKLVRKLAGSNKVLVATRRSSRIATQKRQVTKEADDKSEGNGGKSGHNGGNEAQKTPEGKASKSRKCRPKQSVRTEGMEETEQELDHVNQLMFLGPMNKIGILTSNGMRKVRNQFTSEFQPLFHVNLSDRRIGVMKEIDMTFFELKWSSIPLFEPGDYRIVNFMVAAMRKARSLINSPLPQHVYICHDVLWAAKVHVRLLMNNRSKEYWFEQVRIGYRLIDYGRPTIDGLFAYPSDILSPFFTADHRVDPSLTNWIDRPARFWQWMPNARLNLCRIIRMCPADSRTEPRPSFVPSKSAKLDSDMHKQQQQNETNRHRIDTELSTEHSEQYEEDQRSACKQDFAAEQLCNKEANAKRQQFLDEQERIMKKRYIDGQEWIDDERYYYANENEFYVELKQFVEDERSDDSEQYGK